ncbi:hypothetical protein [Sporohalobacter salinus]|uniref:hypothetical protein n=1 Tax=Sporohalobacter salinus TaxID=1494606 RepID=UPI001961DFC3|nr:hypothetical protein [Sporohalobacter salinus]MBM7624434.1 nitrogen regulatory protein PII [Sporohalobacter salinus]
MELLVAVVEDNDELDQILEGFKELGIHGVTILDSMGTGHLLTEDISIFGRLIQVAEGNKKHNKTLFTIIEDESILHQAINVVEDIVGDITQPHTALLFTIPVNFVKGLTEIQD